MKKHESNIPMNHNENFNDYLKFGGAVVGVLVISLIAYNIQNGRALQDWMLYFMSAYFLTFGFFKLINYDNFVNAYMLYDVVAKRSKLYAQVFPFIELLLGSLYLVGSYLTFTHIATVVVMGVSLVGVVNELRKGDMTVTCACLGTVINLPVTKITLIENALMG